MAGLFGVVIWMHPSWHLFFVPVFACLLARRFRLAAWLTGALLLGVLVAGILYGNPFEFTWQSVLHTMLAFGTEAPPGTLVIEFNPGSGAAPLLLGVLLVLLWRYARGRWRDDVVDNPVFLLAASGWLLGWMVMRFWSDWGTPALLVWLAVEMQEYLEERLPDLDLRRVGLAFVAGLAALLILSANARGSRYLAAERPYLSLTSPTIGTALPDPGGVLYTDDMRLFFQLFYHRPKADWRYVVGYEPALMLPEDLATFRKVLSARSPDNFAPWVEKMGPADRLIIQSAEGQPKIPGLAWTRVSATVWSGRRPPGRPR